MKQLTSATAIGMILAATPALAEVTPQSVWESLSSYYERYGLTVQSGAVDEAGDTLTVRDLVLSQTADTGDTTIDLGDVVFTATGDGAVRMDLADQATITSNVTPMPAEIEEAAPEDEAAGGAEATDAADADTEATPTPDATADAPDTAAEPGAPADDQSAEPAEAAPSAEDAMDQTGGDQAAADAVIPPQPTQFVFTANLANEDITIREDGDAMVYDYLLPKLDMTVTRVTFDDGSAIENPATITMNNVKGSDWVEGSDAEKTVQSASADDITVDIDLDKDGTTAKGQIVIAGIAANSETSMPAGAPKAQEFADMLKAGLTTKGDMTLGSLTADLDMQTMDNEGQPRKFSIKADSAESALNFAIDQSRISYAGTGGAANAELTVPDLPAPVGYGIADSTFDVDFPIEKADAAQDFKVSYTLNGIALTDSVWALFDPQNALPRDPASVDVDLSGSVKVLQGLLDGPSMADISKLEDPNTPEEERAAITEDLAAPPVDLREITLNKVALSLLGATADVSGKLSAPETGTMETPVGSISGRFEGLNGTLDKLGQAGLIPAEQMMGVRMMLAMFAKADPQNPEVMNTELEFKEGGQIFANGQQVK
ncbi:DUF2125 domain-containing protein [Paracoccus aurantiacus]|uniref:DUF2125 domain-containing protein n=1 Tax=Paracoccus aurantiacus TaxID=2599412 RepID=A0A5C6S2C6_9RHOB|nr:DUF2125 domain-containing protein [Paracoccus aurantiacus]TXB67772.1 DUF2125 domain-containing protein [Paracoccus aurantiacus]